MQLRILPPVLTFFLRRTSEANEPNPRRALVSDSQPLHFHSARCSRSLARSLGVAGNSESRNQRNMKRDICASHKTCLIIFVCRTRGDQMSHLYSRRERERERRTPRCVRAGADDDAQRASASKQCPPRSLYCRCRAACARSGTRVFNGQKGKKHQKIPKRLHGFWACKNKRQNGVPQFMQPDFITYRLKCVFGAASHFSPRSASFVFIYFHGNNKAAKNVFYCASFPWFLCLHEILYTFGAFYFYFFLKVISKVPLCSEILIFNPFF